MKQFVLCVFVMMAFVFAPALQAQARLVDHTEELNQKIEGIRAQVAAEGHTYKVGMNPAMNYSLDQLCTFKPSLAGPLDIAHENNESGLSSVMAFPYDYIGYCSPIKDQGACGSCWAYAIIGAIEGQWKKVLGTYYDFSEQHLVDCNSYGYGCGGGWWLAYNDIVYPHYFKLESQWPSGAGCWDPPYADYLSAWYYVDNGYSVPANVSIKRKIYEYGCVSAAVYVNSAFQAYTGGCYTSNYSGSVNHAIVLYGWDDNQCGGIWYLKNSWGTGWGESGTMRIGYAKQQVGYSACYPVH